MEKHQNKYRIESARHQHWDYGSNAAYFITICTKNKRHYFGEIRNQRMCLSRVGVLADVFWYEIKNRAKNIQLGAFVVMPNHIHGVLVLSGNPSNEFIESPKPPVVETRHALSAPEFPEPNIMQTRHALSLQESLESQELSESSSELIEKIPILPHSLNPPIPPQKTIGQLRFQNQGGNTISSIIGGYKSSVTKHMNRLGFEFCWQSRFHDHIIRNQSEFSRIHHYIKNNPINWKEDRFYRNS